MIETVKIQVGGYLVNGNMSVPKADGNIDYEEVKQFIADGGVVEPEFTAEELLQQTEDAKPKVVTPLQARLALSQLGIRQQVEDSMLTATQDIKDFYEFALEWRRDNTHLIAMATSLGMDSVAIDNFFLLASTL